MKAPLFILIRHGRTAGNEKNLYRGWSNAPFAQLDDNGRQDAREAGIFVKGLDLDFAAILTDDLDRTKESAKIISDILGGKEIISDKRLRPINVGDFTGKNKDEHPLEEYQEDKNKKIPGGDSINVFNRQQVSVFDDILQLIVKLKKPVLVVGHGSNASFLNNATSKNKVGYEGITNPGGVMAFDKDGIIPLLKKREPKEVELLDQAEVLYMSAEEIGKSKGAHCDDCIMFIGEKDADGKCGAVAGKIKAHGVCGLYVFGEPNQLVKIGTLSKETAGYTDDGLTHCGTCKYFGGEGKCAKVKNEPKKIEFGGCCNAYEKKENKQ